MNGDGVTHVCMLFPHIMCQSNEQRWLNKINDDIGRNGDNKLRTYCTFKNSFSPEAYVTSIMSKKHRSAMAKFRCGVAPIKLETGRYNGTPVNNRICEIMWGRSSWTLSCMWSPRMFHIYSDLCQQIINEIACSWSFHCYLNRINLYLSVSYNIVFVISKFLWYFKLLVRHKSKLIYTYYIGSCCS